MWWWFLVFVHIPPLIDLNCMFCGAGGSGSDGGGVVSFSSTGDLTPYLL